jgi:hypothetical protein
MAYTTDSITPGVGAAIAVDRITGTDYQVVKWVWGGQGVATEVTAGTPLPVEPGYRTTEQCARAVISCAASGDNTIVGAVALQFVRIYGIVFTVDSPVSVKLGDTTPAYSSGAMKFGLGGGLFWAEQGHPYLITAIGKGFVINLSAAVQCSGIIWYQQGV